MSSRTRIIHSAKLLPDPEIASVVLRLMMALNDLGLANDALQEWDTTQDPKKKVRQDGGKLYFGRMQMAHIYEALLVIEETTKSSTLMRAVECCDAKTRESFEQVTAFLSTGDYKILCRIRNNASFHYNGKLAVRALRQIVKRRPQDVSPCSLGGEPLDWYFELGDKVIDRFLVREIFEVKGNADMRAAINEVLARLHVMAVAFSDFAGHFIRQHAR
jgi:hypothetical protein